MVKGREGKIHVATVESYRKALPVGAHSGYAAPAGSADGMQCSGTGPVPLWTAEIVALGMHFMVNRHHQDRRLTADDILLTAEHSLLHLVISHIPRK